MPVYKGKWIKAELILAAIDRYSWSTIAQETGETAPGYPPKFKQNGDTYKINTTMKVFHRLGTTCQLCKLEGTKFRQERDSLEDPWHLILYGKENGQWVKMTRDHILPKSKGGSRKSLKNMMVLCDHCNNLKGDMVPSALKGQKTIFNGTNKAGPGGKKSNASNKKNHKAHRCRTPRCGLAAPHVRPESLQDEEYLQTLRPTDRRRVLHRRLQRRRAQHAISRRLCG